MPRTIECANCGASHETKRANTKYCGVCQLVRGIIAMSKFPARCSGCGEKYYRVGRGRTWFCYGCVDYPFRSRDTCDGKTCAECGREGATLHSELQVCLRCVTSPDPALHARVLRGLQAKVVKRARAAGRMPA